MMEMLTIEELIAHCNRQLKRVPSGTKTYQEHESVRTYLQTLRHYTASGLSPREAREVGSLKSEVERLNRENFWLTSEREPKPGWIAMEDKLPPKEGSYIVCTKYGAVCTSHYNERVRRFGGPYLGVTHWMLLPEPPERNR